MGKRIHRSIKEPIRKNLTADEKWRGDDKGLILCWEEGRELAETQPKLMKRAQRGELPMLSWKGGVKRNPKKKKKAGSFCYLAQWQGLKGDDLDIKLSEKQTIKCSRTGVKVVYSLETTIFAVP